MTRVLQSRLTCVLQSRPTHLTHVLRLCKTHVKYDTVSDFPLLPLGKNVQCCSGRIKNYLF